MANSMQLVRRAFTLRSPQVSMASDLTGALANLLSLSLGDDCKSSCQIQRGSISRRELLSLAQDASLGEFVRFRAFCSLHSHADSSVEFECLAYRDPWHQLALIERRAPALSVSPLGAVSDVFKVMCFNVFNFNVPWAERLELIVDRILAADPLVVLLQELRFMAAWVHAKAELRSSRMQIVHIVNALRRRNPAVNWQFVHVPSAVYTHAGLMQLEMEGVAILSRAPIIATDHLFLSRDLTDGGDSPHQRVVLRARVAAADGGAIDFFTSHFSLSEPAQLRGVNELDQWLNALQAADPDIPQVLGGDLNALSSALSIQQLGHIGFVDTWIRFLEGNAAAKQRADSSATFGATFPTLGAQPHKRIDYIMVRNAEEVRVPNFEVVADEGVNGEFKTYAFNADNSMKETSHTKRYWASDHLAVCAELQLSPRRRSPANKDEL